VNAVPLEVGRPGRLQWNTAAMEASRTVVVVGYAKVPLGSTLRASHEFLSLILLVDQETHEVIEVDSTAVTAAVRRWLADLLVGRDLSQPLDAVVAIVESNYLGHAAGAIKQAAQDASRRYQAHLRGPEEARS
jgi:hypothetical protein